MNSFLYKNKNSLLRIKRLFNAFFKIEIIRYPTPELDRRVKLLKHYNIEVVLDIGANIGQYAGELRNLGYMGRIISFEPLPEAFAKLSKNAQSDSKWDAVNSSLGERDGNAVINISENSVSSSLLSNLPELTKNAPRARFVQQQEIRIAKLDTLFKTLELDGKNIFMKIDTQGYEEKVLEGAKESLSNVTGIQMEMAFVPSYESAPTFSSMKNKLETVGFNLVAIESGFYDKTTGKQLEVDGIFFK